MAVQMHGVGAVAVRDVLESEVDPVVDDGDGEGAVVGEALDGVVAGVGEVGFGDVL